MSSDVDVFDAFPCRCDFEGCTRDDAFACHLLNSGEREQKPDGYYCPEHATLLGYCCSCGDFWGGIDSFEQTGLCDHCRDELDEGEEDWDDEDLYAGDDFPDDDFDDE